MDNGLQFDNTEFVLFFFRNKYGIKNAYTTPAYPKSNGQVEATNKVLKYHLRSHLSALKGGWLVELPYLLWSYQTTCRTTTKETPFSLVFGTKAIALIEIGMKTYRINNFQVDLNDKQLQANLNLLEEQHDRSQ